MRSKKRMTLKLNRTRASNNIEKKRPGMDEEERKARKDFRMYYIFGSCWLSWATAFTASLLDPLSVIPCQPVKTPPSCGQGTRMRAWDWACGKRASCLETHALARVFRGREGTGGRQTVWHALMGRKTWRGVKLELKSAKLKQQEVCAKLPRANAGTDWKGGGGQPLSAQDIDMGGARMPVIIRSGWRWKV
jgi:hypothetical protein